MTKRTTVAALAIVASLLVANWLTFRSSSAPQLVTPLLIPSLPSAEPPPPLAPAYTPPLEPSGAENLPDVGQAPQSAPPSIAPSAPDARLPAVPAPAPAAVESRTAVVEPAPVPALEPVREPPPPLREPPALIPPAAAAAPAPVSSAARSPKEMSAVQGVLDRYRQMYSDLNASAAPAIWPQADTRALERVFARLQRQELDFDDCVIALSELSATAQCAGRLRYIPRVGSPDWRSERHSWTIQLQRSDEEWTIVRVNAR